MFARSEDWENKLKAEAVGVKRLFSEQLSRFRVVLGPSIEIESHHLSSVKPIRGTIFIATQTPGAFLSRFGVVHAQEWKTRTGLRAKLPLCLPTFDASPSSQRRYAHSQELNKES